MHRVAESVRSTYGQDGAVVLDIRQGQMFNLNVVGSKILRLIENRSSQPEIVDEIVREFGVSRQLAEKDVENFFETLTKHRLIKSVDPA